MCIHIDFDIYIIMDEKVINHLFHKHPLILRNVSEMMIVESVDCYACGKGINIKECAEMVYVCKMHLEGDHNHCSINHLILHRKCGELPKEIRHHIHPHHPIHLFNFRLSRWHRCNVCCREIGKVFGYRCQSCDFDLDITCEKPGIDTLLEERKHELQHPSHPDHPLTLMRKPAFAFCCDGCGEVDVDMAYICSTCEFWVHKKCASLPLIHQYPYHHHHPLSLVFSFPKDFRFKYRYRCEVCDKRFDTTCWVYVCGDCRYFVHLKCVGSTPIRNSILNDNSSGVIQLPLHVNDIYKELITPFVKNMMREEGGVITPATATFFDHEKHPLSLVSEGREAGEEEDDGDDDDDDELKKKVMICSVCVTPISSPPYYQCAVPNCKPYFIHSICYSLPDTLQYSSSSYPQSDESHHLLQLYGHYNKIHNLQNHKFELHSQSETNDKDVVFCECNICGYHTNGMWYECEECDVKIDVKCASLPTTIRHASHPHHKPLILTRIPPHQEKLQCRGCLFTLKHDIAYFCSSDDCDFALDLRCAQLPLSITEHQWNMNCNHPLLLTFDASLDHPSDFFCEFCEVELNPKGWMYHCRQCDISVHLDCLKAASGAYRNIKFGRRFEMDGIHPHPLTFNHITLQKQCHLCSTEVYTWTGFECASCYYVVCRPCGRRQLHNI